MKKKKILFITPPFHARVVEVAGRWIPLNMVYLAGAARLAGFEAKIYDAMTKEVGIDEIRKQIEEFSPDVVAATAITCTVIDALRVLAAGKSTNPNIVTLLGGIHSTFMYEEVLTENPGVVDYIIRGEGEETIQKLLLSLASPKDLKNVDGIAYLKNGKLTVTRESNLITDLDSLPKAWDLLDWEDYTYFIIPNSRLAAIDTSRGCTKSCTFCSQWKFYKGEWRGRKPEKIVEDMEILHNRFGVNVILLTDDYPTVERERWEKILDLLIEKDMGIYILMETVVDDIIRDKDILHKYRKAGIVHIYIGTEATNTKTLEYIKKEISVKNSMEALRLLDQHEIITETSMILGFPFETKESVSKTIEIAKEYNPDFCHFLAISPWPYADIYEELKDYIKVFDYRKYDLIDPIVEPEKMTLREIDQAIINGYKEFYMAKFREIKDMKKGFKRSYILTAMKKIMTNSFIQEKIGNLGMPPEVKTLVDNLDSDLENPLRCKRHVKKI